MGKNQQQQPNKADKITWAVVTKRGNKRLNDVEILAEINRLQGTDPRYLWTMHELRNHRYEMMEFVDQKKFDIWEVCSRNKNCVWG